MFRHFISALVCFANRMISSDDRSADSIIIGGLLALNAMAWISFLDVVMNKHEFSASAFGMGCGAILGCMGGGKALRDKFTPPPAPGGS